jgi:hypothetical protein
MDWTDLQDTTMIFFPAKHPDRGSDRILDWHIDMDSF